VRGDLALNALSPRAAAWWLGVLPARRQLVPMRSFVVALVAFAVPSASKLITFDNTKPRLDSQGAILRAHDGTTQRFGAKGPYYCARSLSRQPSTGDDVLVN
jgi:hypothetical protein